jgi:hypothetical protein
MARGGTACCGFVIAIAMLCPAASPAQTPIDDAARSVTAGCPEAIRNAGQPQSFDAGMCLIQRGANDERDVLPPHNGEKRVYCSGMIDQ